MRQVCSKIPQAIPFRKGELMAHCRTSTCAFLHAPSCCFRAPSKLRQKPLAGIKRNVCRSGTTICYIEYPRAISTYHHAFTSSIYMHFRRIAHVDSLLTRPAGTGGVNIGTETSCTVSNIVYFHVFAILHDIVYCMLYTVQRDAHNR